MPGSQDLDCSQAPTGTSPLSELIIKYQKIASDHSSPEFYCLTALLDINKVFTTRGSGNKLLVTLSVQSEVVQGIGKLTGIIDELSLKVRELSSSEAPHLLVSAPNVVEDLETQLGDKINIIRDMEEKLIAERINYARLEGKYDENCRIMSLLKDDLIKATKVFTEVSSATPMDYTTYANVAGGEEYPPQSSDFGLFVNPIDVNEPFENTRAYITTNISLDLYDIRVNYIRKVNRGVKISFPGQADLDTFVRVIESLNNFKDRYTLRAITKRQPQLIIKNVPSDLSAEALFDGLKRKHPCITDGSATLVHSFRVKGGSHYILEVTPAAIKEVLNTGYVYCGWHRFRVDHYVSVKRCSRCFRLGHTTRSCPEPVDRVYCKTCCSSLDHDMRSCNELKCINCLLNNKKFKTMFDVNHNHKDSTCPTYNKYRDMALEFVNFG